MKRNVLLLFAGIIFLSFSSTPAKAGKESIIIEKLVEKGILSRSEAEELLRSIEEQEAREKQEIRDLAAEAAREEAQAKVVKLPTWVEKLTFNGDLRLRYQGEERDNADGSRGQHRSRGRFRLRAAAEAEVNPQLKVGFGVASGNDDPRSTNQTLENTFDTPDLRIDLAYADYSPFKWLQATGGKFKNPFWQAKDLEWDTDIRPEGLAAKVGFKPFENLELSFRPAFYIVDELSSSSQDPVMWAFQWEANWKFAKDMYLKLAPAYYVTDNFRGNAFPNRGRTGNNLGNSTDEAGNFLFEYNAVAGDVELGISLPGPVPFLALFGQYVQSDADDSTRPAALKQGDNENRGWLAGIKFGYKSVKEPWQWQAEYNYRELEKDAWPDFLPDSDFYGGSTNVKGHEIEFTLGLHKNVTIGADYYRTEINKLLPGESNRREDLIQIDLNFKW
jgi:hypothetical protein